MQRLLILFIIVSSSYSSVGQSSLIGEWKPVKVQVYNVFNKTTTTLYDENNMKSVKENLLKQYISDREINWGNLEEDSVAAKSDIDREYSKLDTVTFKKKIDDNLSKSHLARLTFKNDSSVLISSYGLIIPDAVPGWHFGDEVNGKWTQHVNQLKIEIGDNTVNHPFYYKIIKQKSDSLVLGLTMKDYEEIYMTLEFVRL